MAVHVTHLEAPRRALVCVVVGHQLGRHEHVLARGNLRQGTQASGSKAGGRAGGPNLT
jgi:hypothetical protein